MQYFKMRWQDCGHLMAVGAYMTVVHPSLWFTMSNWWSVVIRRGLALDRLRLLIGGNTAEVQAHLRIFLFWCVHWRQPPTSDWPLSAGSCILAVHLLLLPLSHAGLYINPHALLPATAALPIRLTGHRPFSSVPCIASGRASFRHTTCFGVL